MHLLIVLWLLWFYSYFGECGLGISLWCGITDWFVRFLILVFDGSLVPCGFWYCCWLSSLGCWFVGDCWWVCLRLRCVWVAGLWLLLAVWVC